MNALRSHLIPFDLPADKLSAYHESQLVLVCALNRPNPVTIFTAIAGRQEQLDGDGRNLRFPINSRLEPPSQAVTPTLTSEVST